MKIYPQRTKNELTAWAPLRLGGQVRFGARYRPSYPLENFLSEALVISCVVDMHATHAVSVGANEKLTNPIVYADDS